MSAAWEDELWDDEPWPWDGDARSTFVWWRPLEEDPPRVGRMRLDWDRTTLWYDDDAAFVAVPIDVPDAKKRITWGLQFHGYPQWTTIEKVRRQVAAILHRVRIVLQSGQAAVAAVLAAHTVTRLDEAITTWSFGTALETECRALEHLHLDACRAAALDPAKLGLQLAKLTLETDREWFADALPGYVPVLGQSGLAAYRRRVTRDWSRLEACRPGDSPWRAAGYRRRRRVAAAMEAVARAAGDTDELVRVIAHDRSHAHAYVRIAAELERVGRQREALAWLERGYASFGPDDRGDLPAALAEAYQRDGHHEDAARAAANGPLLGA